MIRYREVKWKILSPGDYVSTGYRFKCIRRDGTWVLIDMLDHWKEYPAKSLMYCKNIANDIIRRCYDDI